MHECGEGVSTDQVGQSFKQIGIIKTNRKTGKSVIYLYPKAQENQKGRQLSFDDPPSAKAAIGWFDSKEVHDNINSVIYHQKTLIYERRGKWRWAMRSKVIEATEAFREEVVSPKLGNEFVLNHHVEI